MMTINRTLITSTLLLAGCGVQVDEKTLAKIPGYQDAKRFCSQCHKLPYADQHHPSAWPVVIKRMEDHMAKAKRKLPTPQELKTITGYFQTKIPN